MTTYMVRKSGSDSNGGTSQTVRSTATDGVTNGTNTLTSVSAAWTSADIGHGIRIGANWRLIVTVPTANSLTFTGATIAIATGITWTIGGSLLTVGKSVNTGTIIAAGDSIYIGAGVYREVGLTPVVSGSSGNPISLIGDTNGAITSDAGEVQITAFTTSDTSAASATAVMALNGKTFWTLQNLLFIGANNAGVACIDGSAGGAFNWIIQDCYFIGSTSQSNHLIQFTSNAASNTLIDRCSFLAQSSGAALYFSASSTPATGIIVQNCVFIAAAGGCIAFVQTSGTPTGGLVKNCTFNSGNYGVDVLTGWSTATPVLVYNNVIMGCNTAGLAAGTSGEIIEDYNVFICPVARLNVTAGTHSVVSPNISPLVDIGQSLKIGDICRPFLTPSNGSPLLGFGNNASTVTVDQLNRVRPAGGPLNAIGALERHDTIIPGGAANADGGTGNCWQQTGPMDDEFQIAVDAVSTAITIKQKTSGYGGTAYPQIVLLANPAIGVTTQTVADIAANTSYTTLSLAAFTPTAAGVVRIRLQNLDSSGTGIVYWDTWSVS